MALGLLSILASLSSEQVPLLLVIGLLVLPLLSRRLQYYLPPLPPSLVGRPFVGNLHQLPSDRRFETFRNWSLILGSPIISFKIFQTPVVVLNDDKSITDLLDGRSSFYSDRPQPYFHCELVGRKLVVFSISSENPRLKQYRKLIHSGFDPRSVKSYADILEHYRDGVLQSVESNPKDFMEHLRCMAAGVIMRTTYGWTVKANDDPFIQAFTRASQIIGRSSKPGVWMVDSFPILRFWPSWLPGGGFKREARAFSKIFNEMTRHPFAWTKNHKGIDCFVNRLLEKQPKEDDNHEDIVAYAAEGLYAAGLDTTVSALSYFILLMIQYPEVQKKAQQEIDAIVGTDRLPTLDDEAKLPYLSAVIKEVLRVKPPVPLGLPHRVLKEDIYYGYRIPAGTTILSNIWAALRDPSLYCYPEEFDPNRYLGKGTGEAVQKDPRKLVFGFGRRRCPGEHIALASIFLNAASLLAMFDIKPLHSDFAPEKVEDVAAGPINQPGHFECRFVKRMTSIPLPAVMS